MAKEVIKIADLLKPSVASVDLDGKYLQVTALSDGYTGTVDGTYVYEVKKNGADYKVNEMLYSAKDDTFSLSDEPIIMTDGDTIFYITRTTKDPYNFPAVSEAEVASHEVLEKQILQAFIAFAEDKFKFGNYNVFLAEDPYVYGEPTPPTP